MSQVFAADAMTVTSTTTVTLNVNTPVVTSHFVNPPFQNAKAQVEAVLVLTPGTGTTLAGIGITRNPAAEALQIGASGYVTVVAGQPTLFPLAVSDAIPDGRPVQYQLTVVQSGATGNGSVSFANISVLLMSG